mmetsp:Transcript_81542/g.161893  ORF Transcript_81542/g.161893 Transcript_81542/m.161893 type:complete len:88 (+) Transcript_81542:99-362(+)
MTQKYQWLHQCEIHGSASVPIANDPAKHWNVSQSRTAQECAYCRESVPIDLRATPSFPWRRPAAEPQRRLQEGKSSSIPDSYAHPVA